MTPPPRTAWWWPRIVLVLLGLAPLASAPARAAGGATCNLTTTPLAFGNYVPASSTPSDFTATISLTCTASSATPVPVQGTIALASSGGPSGRRLADGARRLRYQLYLDPARTVLWGDHSGGSDAAAFSGVAGASAPYRQELPVYGRILARQSGTSVGHYSDQITVILNY